ncbi:Mitochondrial presequence protease [Glutinoglossum americanum]|uniref:Presequence protease, mitochondrial n=1 Tax=Glutinoglossum americanum TaxID=1670608 RepID=A0A9P8I2V4_9PEZI|nr:Mitochondrial presequence protease [Glutinoglossum americanum]
MFRNSPRWVSKGSGKFISSLLSRSNLGCRKYACVSDLTKYPKPGDKLYGFTLKRAKHVPELELSALHLQHDQTGAEYIHVARDDKNNVFSIGFKTNPPDDTGVPHILEHVTLCGSEKYPVRDPFFKMLPRSLSNFMNAFTSSDHTTYPFATTNRQDFNNLLSVYLDATLNPLLTADDFLQEGWRIGPEDPSRAVSGEAGSEGQDKDNNRLVFKGVVYNEMKGQMSDASYLYYVKFQDHIFPSINNSGGDPQRITDLTHGQLKKFHADHYHPSNAKIFTYGDMPLGDHLKEIGSVLDKFEQIAGDTEIRDPISLEDGPKFVTLKGPIDPLMDKDMQFKTSTSWLMGDSSDILEAFSSQILSSLLLDGYGSPFYRGLIEAGLGPEWSPNTGYDGSGKRGIFSVGLTGVKEANVPKVRESIAKTLQDVRQKGFDKTKVDGLLHQLELGLKHKTANFGMGLMQRLKPGWFNGVDPFDALAWDETVAAFKEKYTKGGYLEELLDRYLLNDKTLVFTMEPSAIYSDGLAAEEAARLATKIAEITKQAGTERKAQEALQRQELNLLEVQEKARNQDLSCLPTLHVRDIPRQKERKEVRHSELGDVKVQWREAPTNGLTYFRAVNTFGNLPEELRMHIPLFTDAILRLGTKDKTMEQLEDLIKLKSGGIRAGYHSSTSPVDLGTYSEGLVFSGYALDRNVRAMYELLRTILLETDFSSAEAESMIRQLLQGAASGAVNSIAESGHGYARRFAEAGLTSEGRLKEEIAGLSQVRLTAELAGRAPAEGLQDVIEKLKAIQQFAIVGGSTMRTAITCGAESVSHNEKELQQFLSSLPQGTAPLATGTESKFPNNGKTFFPLPYQVYYTAQATRTVPYTHPAGASLQVLAQLLTHKHLHHEIREKGGAYGGGAYSRGLGGVFGFYSYRDPNPLNTMKIVRESGAWARERQWTERDIEEAKLSVFQSLDAPKSVSSEGMTLFLEGVTEEMAQARREQLLDVTERDVGEAAQKYLVEGMDKRNLAVLGETSGWVKADDGWEVLDLGMAPAAVSEEELLAADAASKGGS